MKLRAKFTVHTRSETSHGTFNVEASPVTGGSEENRAFFKYTPSGNLELGGITPEAAAQLQPGKTYYVDISEAPPEPDPA